MIHDLAKKGKKQHMPKALWKKSRGGGGVGRIYKARLAKQRREHMV